LKPNAFKKIVKGNSIIKIKNMKPFLRISLVFMIFLFSNIYLGHSQTILNADNTADNTYELINSVLAPGGTAIETPDQTPDGLHTTFGRHIAEVFDTDLNKNVFEFYSHVTPDNDVTGGLDRQRVEMKTYAASPSNLKGVLGETVTYKWRFKIPVGFQPSTNFSHIHQVKAVDGDDSSPIFTLTPRFGTPNTLQLIYVVDSNGSNDYKAEVNLSLFEGIWVEALETIKVGTGASGTYSITIKKVSDGTVLLSYSNNAIQTIRTAATDLGSPQVANSFIRPKWGIYRSLASSSYLRDESLRISDVLIAEGTASQLSLNQTLTFNALPTKNVGTADFPAGATTTASGLIVLLTSSNTAVATILGNKIHIVGAGTATITASQSGNTTYNAATNVTQTLTVNKLSQTISFGALPAKETCQADFSAGATASSGLTVSYASSNEAVATIISGNIHMVGVGTANITASQLGDATYNAAPNFIQTLTVVNCSNLKIILKLDDFSASAGSSAATPILDYLITKKIKAAIGFIADRNDATALSVFSPYLNQTNVSGEKLFEVWHHGLDHVDPEFDATTYAYQKAHFEQANQLILDDLRVQMHSFGAPYNHTDATTNTVISENSNYKVTIFSSPAADVSTGILNLNNRVNMEIATGVPDYASFVTNYNANKGTYTDYMVLQGHPNQWTTDAKKTQFSQIVDFLISEGVEFVLPYDYYLSLNPSYPSPSAAQTISFSSLANKTVGEADYNPAATASSGLAVTYNSSNPAVATIVNGSIHPLGVGTTIITASQMGNATYQSADYVSKNLTVTKGNQTITFNSLPAKSFGDLDFSSGASASSGLAVSLASSNTAVATIVSGNIHIVGVGTTTITASQTGNTNYNAATNVIQTLTVSSGLTHIIAFVLPLKYTNSTDFDPAAISSIGSPIVYTSSNPAVATIVNNKIHIIAKGTSNITASAVGNGSYDAAMNVQQLIVQCSCVQ
jgi:hypothetical protein